MQASRRDSSPSVGRKRGASGRTSEAVKRRRTRTTANKISYAGGVALCHTTVQFSNCQHSLSSLIIQQSSRSNHKLVVAPFACVPDRDHVRVCAGTFKLPASQPKGVQHNCCAPQITCHVLQRVVTAVMTVRLVRLQLQRGVSHCLHWRTQGMAGRLTAWTKWSECWGTGGTAVY